jgi:ketosteroid isomerase-like protein
MTTTERVLPMSSLRALQESAWDAECRHDLAALLDHFHPDAMFYAYGQPPQQGHDAIRALTENFYRSFPDLEIEILGEWTNGDSSGAFEFRAHLTDTEGKRFTLRGVILVEVEGGKFTAVRYYEEQPVPA